MDVPAPFAGIVDELAVKLGDRVSQGDGAADARAGRRRRRDGGAGRGRRRRERRPRRPRRARAAGAPPPSPPARRRSAAPGPVTAPGRCTRARPCAGSRASSASPWLLTAAGARAGSRWRTCERRPTAVRPPAAGRDRRPAGPEPRPVAVDRLREVRAGRARAAFPDPEDLGAQPRAQLGDDPARHPQ